MDEEEKLFKSHMQYLKEDARLLTEEGALINKLQSNRVADKYMIAMEEHDIDSYINDMESLVKQKMALYQNLYGKIQHFKTKLQEEEELHSQTKAVQPQQLYY